jgi:hypothetical protein
MFDEKREVENPVKNKYCSKQETKCLKEDSQLVKCRTVQQSVVQKCLPLLISNKNIDTSRTEMPEF